jgi:hypothetical protein
MDFLRLNLATLLLGLCSLVAHTSSAQDTAKGILQISLVQMQDVDRPRFRVELHNAGDQQLFLNLGILVNSSQFPTEIRFLLTDSDGKLLRLEMNLPPVIGGRIDPMILPLPAGAKFSWPVNLWSYSAPRQRVYRLNLSPGQYTISAEYTGGVPQLIEHHDMSGLYPWPFWTGIIKSNLLSFNITREMRGQHGN